MRFCAIGLMVTVLAGCAATPEEMQSLNQSLQQLGHSMDRPQYNYTAPQIMPNSQPGGNQISCVNAGIYTNCRY